LLPASFGPPSTDPVSETLVCPSSGVKPNIIDGAGFPESLDTSSPLRLLDFPGWQFFDRPEVDSMLGAVHEALEQQKEILYEDEWREFAADWKMKYYDFALYWWVI
jgi:hypothetical protein